MHSDCQTSYSTGLVAEFRARMYLRLRGFRILETRYVTGRHTNRAEIDIIARRKNLIIFVEVKSRPDFITGITAITYPQAARLRRAAETYLAKIHWRGDSRFDAIIVCGRRIHWINGAI